MRYICHIPLIGGFGLAALNITQQPPIAITSYSPFSYNDSLFLRYLIDKKDYDIPYHEIDKLDSTQIEDLSKKYKDIDFAIGLPPCAGLSQAASLSKEARKNSPVNDWMLKSIDFILSTFKPKIYAFENAPGLFTNMGSHVREQIEKIAIQYNYAVTYYKTDTLLHGIPQKRPRTFCVILKGNGAPIINKIRRITPNISEYLNQIPKNATLQNEYTVEEPCINDFEIVKFLEEKVGSDWRDQMIKVREHISSYHFLVRRGLLEDFRDWVKVYPNTHPKTLKDVEHVIKKLSMGKNFRLSHRHLIVDKDYIYAVVGEMMERNVHPTENRRINIREYLHLMGFPHDFELLDKKEYCKVPQNVPVNTAMDIVNEIKEIINKNRELSSERFIMIDNTKEKIKTTCLF